jgi:hypothetical protein
MVKIIYEIMIHNNKNLQNSGNEIEDSRNMNLFEKLSEYDNLKIINILYR